MHFCLNKNKKKKERKSKNKRRTKKKDWLINREESCVSLVCWKQHKCRQISHKFKCRRMPKPCNQTLCDETANTNAINRGQATTKLQQQLNLHIDPFYLIRTTHYFKNRVLWSTRSWFLLFWDYLSLTTSYAECTPSNIQHIFCYYCWCYSVWFSFEIILVQVMRSDKSIDFREKFIQRDISTNYWPSVRITYANSLLMNNENICCQFHNWKVIRIKNWLCHCVW